MSRATVRFVDNRRILWAVPWMLFLAFPVVDLVTVLRPLLVRVVAGVLLAVFSLAYLSVFRQVGCPGPTLWRDEIVVAVLGAGLAIWLGPGWSGLLIYVSAAAVAALPSRWAWPAAVGAAGVCAAVVAADGLLETLFFLPGLCLLTALAMWGTRHLVTLNAVLAETRDELARNAVAEERLRFARDLHDLLGHSLSMIALKSELARRLAERDPVRAGEEMADVEAAARRALAEVRDAVSGYRQVSLEQAIAEARAALSAAAIALRAPRTVPPLPGAVDAALGWVVREATTNVLRHSGARSVAIEVTRDENAVALTVTDDGRGPDAGSAAGSGSGLAGLGERVQALGGRLACGAAGRAGFRLRAELPLPASARPAAERVAP